MKVSMNGLRRNLSRSYNCFVKQLKYDGDFESMNDSQKKHLSEIQAFIGSLNYCYDSDDKDDWDELDIDLEPVFEEDDES